MNAPMTSDPVTGSLARISWVTCWSLWYETPRQGAGQCSVPVPVE